MLTVHAIKIYSCCDEYEVFKTKKEVMKYKNCTLNQRVKEKKLNFNTLFIPCINLCNVHEEYIIRTNAQLGNEHMPIRIRRKLLKGKAVIWFNKTFSLNHPTPNT